MIRIRAIHGNGFMVSQDRVEQAQEIFRDAFPDLAPYADRIPALLRDPVAQGYGSVVLVAENAAGRVNAFALVLHFPEVKACFLDFIATRRDERGTGTGGALYEATREYCARIGAEALYLEVDPDTPDLAPDPQAAKINRRRIRFYEQYGARVIDGTNYTEPVGDPPTSALLIYDGLGRHDTLSRDDARRAVSLILERRFGETADAAYRKRVVESFRDDPVRLRPSRVKPDAAAIETHRLVEPFAICYTARHEIHHVKERGYFERPIRAEAIRAALAQNGNFTPVSPREHGEQPIVAVHDPQLVHYLQTVCGKLKEGRPIYPDTFPLRTPSRRPKALAVQAGYYCIDSGTPLYRNAYVAARAAVNAALTGADEILAGQRLAYAVCRPPGHHAGRRFFGGFCYFNNAAIAAHALAREARTAVLDIDFHHGNGTQDIFYERNDVVTASIHGHPDYAYPYFSGYEDETGSGAGLGGNRNYPLPPKADSERFLRTLDRAIDFIAKARVEMLVVALGFDILKGDPTGTFMLTPADLRTIGRRLMRLGVPLLVVQEGGYNVRNIRAGCVQFFRGCAESAT